MTVAADVESNTNENEYLTTINELQQHNLALKQQIDSLRIKERKLLSALQANGVSSIEEELENDADFCPIEPRITFFKSLVDRGGWLIGLLIFQSCSSYILENNELLLKEHPSIIFFLTMLVGAGGNAGNQSAVRVIRGIAVGSITKKTSAIFLFREFKMAVSLSILLGLTGLTRAFLSPNTSLPETVSITSSLITIVFVSVIAGAILPLLLQCLDIDPAHSSTSIQVIMDILGVLITCVISSFILNHVN